MNNYKVSDILYFEKYYFTDTNECARHFALVLLPSAVMNYQHNLLCSVITSKPERYYSLKLEKEAYRCFYENSYVCFRRRDIEDVNDLSKKRQPVGTLNRHDIKRAFNIIKSVLYGAGDLYMMATVIREWKKISF